jgi:hypothetical protein
MVLGVGDFFLLGGSWLDVPLLDIWWKNGNGTNVSLKRKQETVTTKTTLTLFVLKSTPCKIVEKVCRNEVSCSHIRVTMTDSKWRE